MDNSTRPKPFVPVTLSIVRPPIGNFPQEAEEVHTFGTIVGKGNRRCVLIIAEQRSATDTISIVEIGGIDESENPRFNAREINKEIVSLGKSPLSRTSSNITKQFRFFVASIASHNLPEHAHNLEGSLMPMPRNSLLHQSESLAVSDQYYCFTRCCTNGKDGIVQMPVRIQQKTQDGFLLMISQEDVCDIEICGAQILDDGGRLVAIGVCSDKTASDELVIVAISWNYFTGKTSLLFEIEKAMQ